MRRGFLKWEMKTNWNVKTSLDLDSTKYDDYLFSAASSAATIVQEFLSYIRSVVYVPLWSFLVKSQVYF